MFAVFKRDLVSYFTTPIGYVFMAIFLAINGGLFSLMTLQAGSQSSITGYFSMVTIILAIVIPVLTMKSFSEEKKQKTEQLLLTSPVSLFGIVGGKFLAAFSLFELTFALSYLNFYPISIYGDLQWPQLISNFIGISCLAASLIALGIFLSGLTESQFVASITTIAAILGTLLVGMFSSSIDNDFVRRAVKWFSILDRYVNFRFGLFDASSVLYYVSITLVFLFLSVRILEKRRWA